MFSPRSLRFVLASVWSASFLMVTRGQWGRDLGGSFNAHHLDAPHFPSPHFFQTLQAQADHHPPPPPSPLHGPLLPPPPPPQAFYPADFPPHFPPHFPPPYSQLSNEVAVLILVPYGPESQPPRSRGSRKRFRGGFPQQLQSLQERVDRKAAGLYAGRGNGRGPGKALKIGRSRIHSELRGGVVFGREFWDQPGRTNLFHTDGRHQHSRSDRVTFYPSETHGRAPPQRFHYPPAIFRILKK